MAPQLIKLDFEAYEPKLTPEAQVAFDKWRGPYDDLLRAMREVGNWSWAGELAYRINGVKRMCRSVPQPVSGEHMRAILGSVTEHYALPVVKHDPVVALIA